MEQVKSDQFSRTLAGYKWFQKVTIFGKVKEKGWIRNIFRILI
jgi:hypothetical protein